MKSNLNQFVPSQVCLQCDGCCRFKEKGSAWRPKMAREEITQLKILSFPNALVPTLVPLGRNPDRIVGIGNPDEAMSGPPTKTCLTGRQAFEGDNSKKKSLADLILSKEIFSKDGAVETVSCGGEHLCSFFNPQDHTCRIYQARPFECRLYPFILTRHQQKAAVFVHLMCPYVQQERRTQHFEDYVVYLKKFFQESEIRAFLDRNPALIGHYSDYQEELECLFTLPAS